MSPPGEIAVRPMRAEDVGAASRICRIAFGTFLGLPDPSRMFGDADLVAARFRAWPQGALVATVGDEVVGSNFVTVWGSFGFFGPLSIRPDLWDRGIAKRLLEPTMEIFRSAGTRDEGLFTFAQSPKHVGLYQGFGFQPRFLTAILVKPVGEAPTVPGSARFSSVLPTGREGWLREARALTESVHHGLDLGTEIRATDDAAFGDTVFLTAGSRIDGLALCHFGAGTEAGSGVAYVKFGAVASGRGAPARFRALVAACEALAAEQGAERVVAGMNLARERAHREMRGLGYRTDFQGVAMQRPNRPAYNRPSTFAIDDWR